MILRWMPTTGHPGIRAAMIASLCKMQTLGSPSCWRTASALSCKTSLVAYKTLRRRAITTAIPARLLTPMVVVSPTRGTSRTAIRVIGSTTKSRRRGSTRPGGRLAELDDSKLGGYSLNPDHPGNDGKANGWRALGYDVDSREGRHDATRELGGLLRNELLAGGKVEKTRDTEYGPSHTVLSDFTGPNGRHATVVSCWLIEDREGAQRS